MKTINITAAFIIGMVFLPSTTGFIIQISPCQQPETSLGLADIQILDINYKDGQLIATLYSNASIRTLQVTFYQARIIGDTVTRNIPVGWQFIATKKGETRNVSIDWTGLGHYLITVEVAGSDTMSKEIWAPKSKTCHLATMSYIEHIYKLLSQMFICSLNR